MKNVTITVEDDVLEWARIEAAKRNSSVSRMMGALLAGKMKAEDRYERDMREALKFESFGVSNAPYYTREELYDRAGFR